MAIKDELERTFLAKYIPEGIKDCEFVILEDNYIPKEVKHPILRIRRKGKDSAITKKYKKKESDASVMVEETIPLTPEEYKCISQLDGKKFSKKRCSYEYKKGKFCEIDI